MRSRSLQYMPALDGLRAVAVAMVFWVHAFPGQTSFPGGVGVDVFFVISGFLITWIMLKQVDRTGTIDLKTFYAKRLLRLYPALILMLAVVLALYVLYERGVPMDKFGNAGIALVYLSNVYMTATGEMIDPFSHTWSLAMEEQFYLVWPVAFLVMVKLRLSPSWMIGITAVFAAASLTGWAFTGAEMPYSPLTKAGGLLVGCILAMVLARRPWQNNAVGYAAVVVFLASLVAGTMGLLGRDELLVVVTLVVPFIVLHLAFGSGPIVTLLSHKALVRLGVISYGVYLWHYPILYVLRSLGLDGAAGAFTGAAATLVVSELSFRLVERPVLRLRDQGSGLVRRPLRDKGRGTSNQTSMLTPDNTG